MIHASSFGIINSVTFINYNERVKRNLSWNEYWESASEYQTIMYNFLCLLYDFIENITMNIAKR